MAPNFCSKNCVIVTTPARRYRGTKTNAAISSPKTAFSSKLACARPKAYAEPTTARKCPACRFVAIVEAAIEYHFRLCPQTKYSSAVAVFVRRARTATIMMTVK